MRDRNLLALLLFSLLAAPVLVIQARRHSGVLPEHQSLNLLLVQVGDWAGDDVPLDRVSREELKLGDYVFREYQDATGAPPITPFIEYEPMEPSAMIHMEEDMYLPVRRSVVKDRRRISLSGRDGTKFTANQSVVSRADDRMLVEYWYQIHGRTVASQSWARYYQHPPVSSLSGRGCPR